VNARPAIEADARPAALPHELDVAVVGGGVLGLATTDALVRRGADVVCFEARTPGQGQSGGLTRTFRHRHDDERVVALAIEARAGWRRWEQRCSRRLLGKEGAVYAGIGAADAAGLARHDVPHRFVEPAEGRELFPVLAEPVGPLLLDPDAGALRARRTIEALTGWVKHALRSVEVHGVTVPPGGRGAEIQTADAIYRARHVVICAGTATPRLAAGVGIDVPVAHGLHARPRFRVRDALRGSSLPCWVDRSGAHGEWVYGSPVGSTGDYVVGLIGDGVDVALAGGTMVPPRTEMQEHVRRVAAYVGRAMPGLDANPVGVRVCVMSKLPAGSDTLGTWQTEAVTVVAGHNLFKLAPVLGELLADAASDGRLPEVLEHVGERSLTFA